MPSSSVAFGEFRLMPDTGELWRGQSEVKLTPRAAAVLTRLVGRAQQIVTKEELVADVWKGKAVGDDALTACIQELRRALGDDARAPRFIKTWHRRGYKLLMPAVPAAGQGSGAEVPTSPTLPDKPSIAVLPFENLSGETGQDYFADGVVEDIITALSRVRWLFVIARNSSFTYKGRAVDVKQVGRELGVRYVLEGSFRKAGNRVRITAQLIDAASGAHLWTHRFDGTTDDIFALQDQVTGSVVGVLTPSLQNVEIDRAQRKPTANMDAYDLYLRAEAGVRERSRASVEQALAFCERAIALDPNFAPAYGTAARCYSIRKSSGWPPDPIEDRVAAERAARGAWAADPDDAVAIACAAHALAYVAMDLDSGASYIERARASNPNYAPCWSISGWIHVWLGMAEVAIEHVTRAMRLSPRDPNIAGMRTIIAHAHYFSGRDAEARSFANLALHERPSSHESLRIGAAAAAMSGYPGEAAMLADRLRQIDPRLRASNLSEVLGPYRNPDHLARYADGLRRAGLPD